MSLSEQIDTDFVRAYKAKDADRVAVLRMLKTALKNKQVELRRELNEAEVLEQVSRQAKQRRESIEQFASAGRTDLADKESRELAILEEYLPKQLSDDETEALVESAIASTGATGVKDMGLVMKAVMDSHKGQVDGRKVSELVRAKLSA